MIYLQGDTIETPALDSNLSLDKLRIPVKAVSQMQVADATLLEVPAEPHHQVNLLKFVDDMKSINNNDIVSKLC